MDRFCNTQVETISRQATPLRRAIERFAPLNLDDMNAVQLLDRTDTKYVLREEQALAALAQLGSRYRVLEIAGQRLNHYQTLYFDTADWQLFRRHHAGVPTRFKVRSRAYVDSHTSFLEVKRKHAVTRRTVKNRLGTPELVTGLDGRARAFLHEFYPGDAGRLEPRLWNSFVRVTLVSAVRCERLTLDLDIRFRTTEAASNLHGLVIAEVKQEGLSSASDWMHAMRAQGIRPTGFSKYCVGVTLLYPEVKSNHFKPKVLLIERLLQNGRPHGRYH